MQTDVAIVGAYGSAGVGAAERLAATPDIDLTLIDGGEPGGGLCILRGCMPSKEVISAAEHRFAARDDHRLTGPAQTVDLETVVETKDEHVEEFASHRRAAIHELAGQPDVTFLQESARFVDDRTLRVGDRTIEAEYVVIATGSTVSVPDLPGIDDVDWMTSADVLDATAFPATGVVMGFGYIGLELVPYLVSAGGMDLTVIEHDDRPLDEADPPFGEALLEFYRESLDVEILTRTTEERLEATEDGGVRLHVDREGAHETVTADELFLFTGRRPAVDGLGLAATGLDPGPDSVADTLQAAGDDRVFVVGDANGREPILHVAKEEGAVAAENIRRHRDGQSLRSYRPLHHHVVFAGAGVLPYARIGHSVESAEAAGIDHVAVTRHASDDGVFRTKDVPAGLARLVVGTDGTVLGYQGLHYHADVMAKTAQVIVEQEQDVHEIPDRAYHPTTPEIIDGLLRHAKRRLAER